MDNKYSLTQTYTYDDAIRKCGFGKFNYILMMVSGGLMGCAFLELTSVNLILPIAQCDLDLSTTDKGILSAIGYIGTIFSSLAWGFLADTRGRRATLVPSLLLATLVTAISSLVTNFWVLVFLRFVNGFLICCASSTTFAYLGEFHDARNRGRVLMITSILYMLTNFLLPTIGLLIVNQQWSFYINFLGVNYKPWRLFLFVCALPNLVCALILIFIIPESPKYVFSQGDEAETLRIFQRIYKMNTGKSILTFDVKGLIKDGEYGESSRAESGKFFKFMWSQLVPLFKGSHLKNLLTACFLQFTGCNVINGFWTFLPEIFNKVSLWIESSGASATVCEIYNGVSSLNNGTETEPVCFDKLEFSTFGHIYEHLGLYAICYAVMGLIINSTGKLVIIIAITVICGLSAFLLIFVKIPSIISYFYVVMLLAGLLISVVNASTVELFPTKMRAMAVCISMMVGRVGSAFGSIFIGLIIEKQCDLTFLMPTIFLAISLVLSFTIPNISNRVK